MHEFVRACVHVHVHACRRGLLRVISQKKNAIGSRKQGERGLGRESQNTYCEEKRHHLKGVKWVATLLKRDTQKGDSFS